MTNYRKLHDHHTPNSSFRFKTAWLVLGLIIFLGCSHTEKVLIPPQMDLTPYRVIGVIGFDSNAKRELQQYVTQNYIQTVQSAQPSVRFLELGSQESVLAKVGRKQLDYEAIKSIGRIYGVDAVMFGQLDLTEPKAKVSLSSAWNSMKAGASVKALLVAKLWETDSGVIRWTNSSRREDSVAGFSASTSGNISFGAQDPEEAYGNLIPPLVYANTSDFRSRYEYRRVK